MEPRHRALLRAHRAELSGQILSENIVPLLYQEEVLTEADVQLIEAQPTAVLRSLQLLGLLPCRGPRAFSCFLRALDDFSWVRERLLEELQESTAAGSDITAPPPIPPEVLGAVPSDRLLSRLASQLGAGWEAVLLGLGVPAAAVTRCRSDHAPSMHGAALAGLLAWRRRGGRAATLGQLRAGLQAAGVHPATLDDVISNTG